MILIIGKSCSSISIIKLMEESHLHFVKCKGNLFVKLVYNFCCKSKRFLLVVHVTDLKPDGFILCIVDAKKALFNFCLCNFIMIPFLLIKSLFDKNGEKLGFEPCRSIPDFPFNGNFKWNEHGENIGKIMMVYVTKEGRGQHVATRMYKLLFDKVKRVDAHVDTDNLSSFVLQSKLDSKLTFLSPMANSYLFTFINE